MSTQINFYEFSEIKDDQIGFSVIAARHGGKWIFVRHKQRTTWEIPGGHREAGETLLQTAHRELQEETGALEIETLEPVCVYGVERHGKPTSYGGLYLARVKSLGGLDSDVEIGTVALFDCLPGDLTYPEIQPQLHKEVCGRLGIR